jgi:outer membrane protein
VRLARGHNPAFQRTRNDVDVAAAAVRSAWAAAFLPGLGASLRLAGTHSTALTAEDPFGHTVRLPAPRTAQSSSASQDIGAQLTLFDGLASVRALSAQRALLAGAAAAIEAHALQLSAQVARDYHHAVRAFRVIALEEALLESARERLVRTEELLRLAARNRVDVLGARGDVARSEQSLQLARGEAARARLVLAATIGIDPTAPFTLDSVLPPVFDPGALRADALVLRALGSHPAVLQRQAALAAARQRAAAARGRRWPTLAATAGYSRNVNRSGFGAFVEVNPLNYRYSFGVTASVPVFTRFQTAAAVSEATAAAEDAEHDLRAARLTLERDVRAALIDLQHAYRTLQLAGQNAELGRERQELAQEQYRLGGITFTDLQNVIDRAAQAERQALDARFQFTNARVSLEERLGARLDD